MDVLSSQLADLQRRHTGAHLVAQGGGAYLLVVPEVPLGGGWSLTSTTVTVLIPAGFPHVKPDCFYADAGLRLATGAEPAASNIQSVFGRQYRWFSWHITTWHPTSGSLDQYMHVCESRLRELR